MAVWLSELPVSQREMLITIAAKYNAFTTSFKFEHLLQDSAISVCSGGVPDEADFTSTTNRNVQVANCLFNNYP